MVFLAIYALALVCGFGLGYTHVRQRYHRGAAAFWARIADLAEVSDDDGSRIIMAVVIAFKDTMPWQDLTKS